MIFSQSLIGLQFIDIAPSLHSSLTEGCQFAVFTLSGTHGGHVIGRFGARYSVFSFLHNVLLFQWLHFILSLLLD